MLNASKLAQIFSVDGSFIPTKASLYLLPSLFNNSNYFDISQQTVIDSSNFYNLTDTAQRIFYTNEITKYSGNGCLVYPSSIYSSIDEEDFNIINYPVKDSGTKNIYIRLKDVSAVGSCEIQLYLNQELQSTTNITFSTVSWEWHSLGTINISDNNIYNLGVKLITNGIGFDQLGIELTDGLPSSGSALAYTTAPYVTAHISIYNINSDFQPTTQLLIHDYKASINDLIQDSWYNFNLNPISNDITYGFLDSYALVLSVSGSNASNFITWERFSAEITATEPSIYLL